MKKHQMVNYLRDISGCPEVFWDANGFYITPFGFKKIRLGAFEEACTVLAQKNLMDFAREFLSELTEDDVRWARSYLEMYLDRCARDARKWARGQRYGPWERFQGNPSNLTYAKAIIAVLKCLS